MGINTFNISWSMKTKDHIVAKKLVTNLKKEVKKIPYCGAASFMITKDQGTYIITINTPIILDDFIKLFELKNVISKVAESIEEYHDFRGISIKT